MKTRLPPLLFVAALVAVAWPAAARADETIKFADPAKPGTVKINLGRGDLAIQGADTAEITVKSEAKAITGKPRKDGLREISVASGFALGEKDNVVTLDAATHDWGRGSGNFKLTVPRNTSIVVQNAWGGDFKCANLSGDIELNSMHGDIKLEDVSGSLIVGTMHGEISASFRELKEGKSHSFTSMNGQVLLRLPEAAKASVRLRTQHGSVLTDFDESVLVTKTESSPSGKRSYGRTSRGLSEDVKEAIREATQVSAVAVRRALEAVRDGLDSARLDSDEARRKLAEARKQIAQIEKDQEVSRTVEERVARDVSRSVARATGAAPVPPAPATPPVPPAKPATIVVGPGKFAIPTISGGKLVTGTLNGGGPEISVSTMNGDVIVRKLQ